MAGRRRARLPGVGSRWNASKDLSFELLRPELVVEAAFEHLQGHRLRHTARFRRWRPDRDPASCTYEQLEVAVPSLLSEVFGAPWVSVGRRWVTRRDEQRAAAERRAGAGAGGRRRGRSVASRARPGGGGRGAGPHHPDRPVAAARRDRPGGPGRARQTSWTTSRPSISSSTHVDWFGRRVLWVAPEPAGPFLELTDRLADRFGTPPWDDEFDEVVPHLTVAHASDGVELVPDRRGRLRPPAGALPGRARCG